MTSRTTTRSKAKNVMREREERKEGPRKGTLDSKKAIMASNSSNSSQTLDKKATTRSTVPDSEESTGGKRIKLDMSATGDEILSDSEMDNDPLEPIFLDDISDRRPLAERSFGPPFKYNVLDFDTVHDLMCISIRDAASVLITVPRTVLRVLLNYRNWDKENLYELFYDSDLSKLFKAAGLMDPNIRLPDPMIKLSNNSECEICLNKHSAKDCFRADCGHCFCNDCWKSYLCEKVTANAGEDKIKCPAYNCCFLLEDDIVMKKLQSNPLAQRKYKKMITGSYIQSNRLLRGCPAPGCEQTIELEQGPVSWRPVTCSCSHCFCFTCSEPWHGPVRCKYIKLWNQKCSDDSETVNWISVNTKACPKCEANIEKNGGCNHMRCNNTNCKYEFCWICLGNWQAHNGDNYNCNRYQDSEDSKSKLALSETSLRRYLFYFDRYFNHYKSLKSENGLNESIAEKIKKLQNDGFSFNDLEYLKKGVQVLCQSRQTLMYTYVFAYYLTRNNAANIFEDNQSDLQRATEELSGFLERDISEITPESYEDMKKNVLNKTNYCESRCQVLLKHVYEGYQTDEWSYMEVEESTPADASKLKTTKKK